MSRLPRPWAEGLAIVLALLSGVSGFGQQRPPPHVAYLYPAGGCAGSAFPAFAGGQGLLGADAAYVSGTGVEAQVVGYDRPPTQKELNAMRERLRQLAELRAQALGLPPPAFAVPGAPPAGKAKSPAGAASPRPVFTPEEGTELMELRDRLANAARQRAPALAETVLLRITVSAGAAPGTRELRIRTPAGLSNPIVLCVGQLPEVSRPVVMATTPRTDPGEPFARYERPGPATEVSLPSTLNGQILPGAVDRFSFAARKGQRLTFAVQARDLIPYLADAVPGWFQAVVALTDARGRELAYADSFRFHPDPILFFTVPEDGRYTLSIRDVIYRGREDFVYRITAGEVPCVTDVFPLGGREGGRVSFELAGWNLGTSPVAIAIPGAPENRASFSVGRGGLQSNPVRIAVGTLPEILVSGRHDDPRSALAVDPPVVVNGRIGEPDGRQVFRFEGRAGAALVAEITARRLGSPLDSSLTLTDATGRRLAFNDDFADPAEGLLTHQADSRISLTLPADGPYFLAVADVQHRGGPAYAYRLRVGPPDPDFELRAVPASVNVRARASAPITVHVIRRDGFEGPVDLRLEDAPEGFFLSGGRIPAGRDEVVVTLTAPAVPPAAPLDLAMIGFAEIGNRTVIRRVVPAEEMMQAFFYLHLVPCRDWKVDVLGPGPAFRIIAGAPLRIAPGGTARVRIFAPPARYFSKVGFELESPPPGISVAASACGRAFAEVVFSCDAAKAKPGSSGNLIIDAFGERRPTPAAARPGQRGPQRIPLGTVPALPFEILSQS